MRFSTVLRARLALAAVCVVYVAGIALAAGVTALGIDRVARTVLWEAAGADATTEAKKRQEKAPRRVERAHARRRDTKRAMMAQPSSAAKQTAGSAPMSRLVEPAVFGTSSRYSGPRVRYYRAEGEEPRDEDQDREGRRVPGGTFRTVCVRLCDGYYFPISFSVPRDRFARDAGVCARSCGGQARLFVYPNPGGNLEDMVDLGGQPYRRLPTAFLYRTQYVDSCRCQPHPWEAEAIARHRTYALAAARRKGDRNAARELAKLNAAYGLTDGRGQPVPRPGVLAAQPSMGLGAKGVRDPAARSTATAAPDQDWRRRVFGPPY